MTRYGLPWRARLRWWRPWFLTSAAYTGCARPRWGHWRERCTR